MLLKWHLIKCGGFDSPQYKKKKNEKQSLWLSVQWVKQSFNQLFIFTWFETYIITAFACRIFCSNSAAAECDIKI